jgi:prepilin-type processing-associated H-X9-DG protein/prepilin-type N-terminal cleavage/methylation domain-containing protein
VPPSSRNFSRRAFTLIELLVVIGIIGLLVAFLLPAIQNSREGARQTNCRNNLHELILATNHHLDTKKKFPVGGHVSDVMSDGTPANGTNWIVELLPYIEQGNLYNQWNYNDNRYNVAGERTATQAQIIEVLICPSDRLPQRVVKHTAALTAPWCLGYYGMSSYGGNAGTQSFGVGMSRDGIFFIDSCVRSRDVIDGYSNTILFGERIHNDPDYDLRQPVVLPGASPIAEIGKWGFVAPPPGAVMGNVTLHTPVEINYRMPPDGSLADLQNRISAFGSGHPGGANIAFADGHVRFVRDSIELDTLKALSTRSGGEVVADDQF